MSIRGIFPAFMKQLRRHWQSQLPTLATVSEAVGSMPRTSTFYVGQERAAGRHVFLWISVQREAPR